MCECNFDSRKSGSESPLLPHPIVSRLDFNVVRKGSVCVTFLAETYFRVKCAAFVLKPDFLLSCVSAVSGWAEGLAWPAGAAAAQCGDGADQERLIAEVPPAAAVSSARGRGESPAPSG